MAKTHLPKILMMIDKAKIMIMKDNDKAKSNKRPDSSMAVKKSIRTLKQQ